MNWWVDMVDPRVEVLIYDDGVAGLDQATVSHTGVSVEYVKRLANPNYAFVGLRIAPGARASSFRIKLSSSDEAISSEASYPFSLQPHPDREGRTLAPLSSRDLMYLIMPDRFANGDPGNDKIQTSSDTLVNRDKFLFRHGGDLRGVIDRLDYLEELGVTALWLNPILENDQPYASYHGYAISDHYRVDPRLGTNELYRQLVEAAHARGMKVVMDVIFNHVGDRHYQINDLPSRDWIHQWPTFTKSNFRAATIHDPYATEYDRKQMTEGWFDNHMPDLDQENPHLAKYLIQNSIWWTLYSGQDAFRIDTYTYPDTKFMAEWNRRIREELPHVHVFGETWVPMIGTQAWFVGGDQVSQAINTNLPAVTDFQLHDALHEAIQEEPSWRGGVNRLYYTLTQDYLYPNPSKNVIFLDNHDSSRLLSWVGGDTTKAKAALTLLLTTRGIPCLYYGTEAALTGAGGAFGEAGRVDFPGGFPGDELNFFDPDQRSGRLDIYDHLQQLARYRKSSDALSIGALTQFVPRDGVYIYFRHHGDEVVMVAYNGNSEPRTIDDFGPYREMLGTYKTGKEITAGMNVVDFRSITLEGKEARVFTLGGG